MGFGLFSTPLDSFLFYIPFKGKERPAKTKLRAVLVTFGFSENIQNFSKYHHMNSKFPGNSDFQKSKTFVQLGAVLASF